jgi:hypothetical protein
MVRAKQSTLAETTPSKTNSHKQRCAQTDQAGCRPDIAANIGLAQSGYRAVRRVLCEFDGSTLILRGSVPTYYIKQVAQSIVLSQLDGTVNFENHLVVSASR